MAVSSTSDYSTVTELPGSGATQEQLARLYHRYHTAAQYAANKRVLEVACGAGLGLGYLAQKAACVVGGDYTAHVLRIAHSHYQDRIPLLRLDAHSLPFRQCAFDLVIVFEALYYLSDAARFVGEVDRVLDANGLLLIGMVNKDWPEFAPSPFSTHYFSVTELRDLLGGYGFSDLQFYGAFPAQAVSVNHRITSLIRRVAVALNLIPRTLAGRARFKRLFYGKLLPLPAQVSDGMAELFPLESLAGGVPDTKHQIIYCLASRLG